MITRVPTHLTYCFPRHIHLGDLVYLFVVWTDILALEFLQWNKYKFLNLSKMFYWAELLAKICQVSYSNSLLKTLSIKKKLAFSSWMSKCVREKKRNSSAIKVVRMLKQQLKAFMSSLFFYAERGKKQKSVSETKYDPDEQILPLMHRLNGGLSWWLWGRTFVSWAAVLGSNPNTD